MMKSADLEDVYELTPLQKGILFHSTFDDDAAMYVNQHRFLIEGNLDADALVDACGDTVRAHSALRTSFHWDGLDKPLQVVHRDTPLPVVHRDWQACHDHQQRLDTLLGEDLAAGFDLTSAPLQRLHLIRLAAQRWMLVWTHHLLVLDGWSIPIFLRDVLQRYVGRTLGGPPPVPAPPYRDYIGWLQRQDLGAAREFWARTLPADAETDTLFPLLPADPSRPPGAVSEQVVDLPDEVEAGLRTVAAAHGVTVNTVLQAAWSLVLQRYSGGPAAVTFGVTSSCRPPELPGIDRTVGLFTNTLPVRVPVPLDGELGPWLQGVQAQYTDVRNYEYSPLDQIKQWTGTSGGAPLFQSLVIFDNYSSAVDLDALTGLSVQPLDSVEKTSVPLVLIATPGPRFTVRVRYHRERWAPGVAEEILECFDRALAAMTDARCVRDVARRAVPRSGSSAALGDGPSRQYPDRDLSLVDLVERQTLATPDATALVTDDTTVTYRELAAGAGRLAAALRTGGVRPGDVVGVCAQRSPELVTGILAALWAGAAYLPLDPSMPPARLRFMVADAGADVVIAQRRFAPVALDAGARRVITAEEVDPTSPPAAAVRTGSAGPAYVMYTSGSTGTPKGVLVGHRAVVNRLSWMQETFGLVTTDRVLHKTPFGFDVSVWELFWPLTTGAATVLARPGGHQDAEYLSRTIRRHGVTTAHFVPSMLELFLDEPGAVRPGALRRVVCSGEALGPALATRFRDRLPDVELHNLYGPTEAAIDVTWWDCSRPGTAGVLPIGYPIANTRAVVLDERLLPVPDAVPGELYLGGVQLADGYLGRSGLTADRFVAHPLAGHGGRLYRTGDRVRRLPDGSLDYLGRLDHQVKINGYRIELGEIEHLLAAHPGVRESAAVVRDGVGGQHIAAYVTAADAGTPDPRLLREHLLERLPPYMLPASITTLPAMPLSHHGKLDRAALAAPACAAGPGTSAAERPATPAEEAVTAVFADVLGLDDLDVTADFFALGGNSYDAVRTIRRIEGASLALLLAHPTARALAAAIGGASEDSVLVRLTGAGRAEHTLVCVPFGGGSAISYRQLAGALPRHLALVAVSPPGHEPGGDPGLRPLEEVAQEAADAVLRSVTGPVSVYGHCAGVGLAVELVRRLEAAGRPVEGLFLGGSYPFYEPGRVGRWIQRALLAMVDRGMLRMSALTVGATTSGGPDTDRAEMRYLKSIGGFPGELVDEDLTFLMRAFRHDVRSAARYFTTRWSRGSGTPALSAPITVVAGTADPLTPWPSRRYRSWQGFGGALELVTIPGGGHYFHQDQPDVVAAALTARCTGGS